MAMGNLPKITASVTPTHHYGQLSQWPCTGSGKDCHSRSPPSEIWGGSSSSTSLGVNDRVTAMLYHIFFQ